MTDKSTSRRPIRVMQFVWGLGMGGMEKTLVNVCNRISREGFSISMCVFESGGPMEKLLDLDHTELIHIRKHFGNDPLVPFRLARELKHRKIDILHTNMWGTLMEGALAAKLARVPIVIHEEHGTIPEKPRQIMAQRWAWRSADRVASVSAALADRMHEIVGYPRDEILVINNSVDTNRFRPLSLDKNELRSEFGLPKDAFVIGMLSRFVPFKNHRGVIRAISDLKKSGVEVHLALVGDGPLAGDLKRQTNELGVSDRIHFVGETDRVEYALNSFDAFVSNSSCNEGLSLALLEAMACGLPVIATDVAAHSEVLDGGKAGTLIAPQDGDALMNAIRGLSNDAEMRDSLANIGRERSAESYGVSAMVSAYEQMYEDVFTAFEERSGSKQRSAMVQ